LAIVDFDLVDDGRDVGLAERIVATRKLLPHGAAELLDKGRTDLNPLSSTFLRTLKCGRRRSRSNFNASIRSLRMPSSSAIR
jgi:hypothetical protein